jgi:hypothetical protein
MQLDRDVAVIHFVLTPPSSLVLLRFHREILPAEFQETKSSSKRLPRGKFLKDVSF